MAPNHRPLAVVTGASTGIGYELAKCCAQDGFDLVVVADEPEIKSAVTAAATSARCP
jgi:short-subunit dehydrogenase